MQESQVDPPGRISPVWTVAVVVTASLAIASAGFAVLYQVEASRPAGEGELFAAESAAAARRLAAAPAAGLDRRVRSIRNDLEVEAVGVVDASGVHVASTSPNLVGTAVDPFLAERLEARLLGAIAHPIANPVYVDGVLEWSPGDVLYEVLQPVDGGGGVVVSYDVSALFARRARERAIRPLTWIVGGASVILAVGSALLLAGRQGARRRTVAAELERRFLQERSQELEVHNRQLDDARRKAERALSLAEETNRVRSEFVLMINHELRTPLTGIVTGVELLLERGSILTEAERERLLDDVAAGAHLLERLIGQMLIVARIENRSLDYDVQPVEPAEVRRRLREIGIQAQLWGDTMPRGELLTDIDTLTQLLAMLVDNAYTHGASNVRIDLVPEPGFDPALHVGDPGDAALYLVVCDDGPGIDPDFLPRIFEKFEKRGRASGTGLGLYLARMLAEGIGASISVRSGGGGTAMAVGIPGVELKARVMV